MTHYMMDCFYNDPTGVDGVRRDSFAVKAGGNQNAITEAKAISVMKNPKFFKVRVITRATDRDGGTCIYDSREAD